MSIENLGGFHDDSEDDGEFDVKQSSREDINVLSISQSNNFQSSFDRFKTDTNVEVDRKERSSLLADAAEKYGNYIKFSISYYSQLLH